jgi:outer membrane protein OmpA-like peptidoglycan-associated protein
MLSDSEIVPHSQMNRSILPGAFSASILNRAKNSRLRNVVSIAAGVFAAGLLTATASGCLATRNWVQEELTPINGKLNATNARLDNLHLERRLVLDSQHGPTFAFGSAALTDNAKSEITGFLADLQGSTQPAQAAEAERIFVVTGHTDNIGSEDYNYQLGQQRANRVAGFLVSQAGIDPSQVRVVSYGPSKPIANNDTASGRRTNRRVEILVYREGISTDSQQAGLPPAEVQRVSSAGDSLE